MGRRAAGSSSKQAKTAPDSAAFVGPTPLPLSPKSNWVTNVQALKGVGAAKVGESFDEEAKVANMKPIQTITEETEAADDRKKDAKGGNTSKKSTKKAKKQSKTKVASPVAPNVSAHTTSVAEAAPAAATTSPEDENNHNSTSQSKPSTPNDPSKVKQVSHINAAAVLSVLATSPRSLSSPKADTDAAKSPQTKKSEKRGGNFKWFRKNRKEKDTDMAGQKQKSPRTPLFGGMRSPNSQSEARKEGKPSEFTSPLRMQLWVGAVQQAIVKVKDEPKQGEETEEPEMLMAQPPIQNPSSFYRHTVDTGVYVDYSTFDDGESVSSIYLLFKWLTCRDVTAEPKPTHIQSDNTQVDSDVSFDADAQPRRRVLFSP